ncbi:MAG: response regulator [Planctomycetota bacterium]
MDHKILFVDDEQAVLNGIQRMLGFDYDLVTANSGTDGLEMMDREGPFSVVFTDMRMPGMDGLSFLKHAQMIAPDSVYVMLTGNNDQATAVNAVNEGRVFRFLNKPCQREVLESVIESSTRQYELINHEKVLLENTFAGAVKMLTDVIHVTRPSLAGLTGEIEKKMMQIAKALRIPDRWEYRVAARLALVGIALIDDRDDGSVMDVKTPIDSKVLTISKSNEVGHRLLSKIPRLETVAKIVGDSSASTGKIDATNDPAASVASTGATLLRVSVLWQLLEVTVDSLDDVICNLRAYCPDLANEVISLVQASSRDHFARSSASAMASSFSSGDQISTKADATPNEIDVDTLALKEGMITAEEIVNEGVLLVKSGRALTGAMIERLRSIRQIKTVKIMKGAQREVACLI